MKAPRPDLYNQHFVQKEDERVELFRCIREKYTVEKGLYPGSFVHITPSFFIPEMVYADTDKRCGKFFAAAEVSDFVSANKQYSADPVYRFHAADFTRGINEPEGAFGLLISLYSGFISQHCKKYLKTGGILLTNNSHGDASIACIDSDFRFVGVVKRRGEKFRIDESNLDSYFRKKDGSPIDKEKVLSEMRGEGFRKTAYAYLFEKVK